MTAHPIPVTTLALHQRVVAAFATDPLVRVDLGPVGEFEEPDAVAIGLATATPEAVPGQVAAAGLGSDRFTFDLVCSAQSSSGDDDPAARLTRVFELVDVVRGALKVLVVSGVWSTGIDRESFAWVDDGRGAVAAFVEFVVRIQADRPL